MADEDPYAAYKDTAGELRLVPSCLLFFDILGTTAMSKSPEAEKHLRALRPALEAAINRAGTDERVFGQASTWFTDNAVVATPFDRFETTEPIIGGLEVASAYLLLVCWGRGFLGRGAITVGEHYMDERFVFGPALIEAVDLEKQARWPRVVLGDTAVQLERRHSHFYSDALQSVQSSCLTVDEEGVVFVDHMGIYIDEEDDEDVLDHFLSLHRDATAAGLAREDPGTEPWEKWRWLAEYHNHALMSRHREPEPYLVDDGGRRHEFRDFLDESPYTPPGSPWYLLDRQRRLPMTRDAAGFLHDGPTAYAVYKDGERRYVGFTKDLVRRVTEEHLRKSAVKTSALRRNLAEHLGFAPADKLRKGEIELDGDQVRKVDQWLRECEIGWLECDTEGEARELAERLKAQFNPPINH